MRKLEFTVSSQLHNTRVDTAIASTFQEITRSQVKLLIASKSVFVNQKVVTKSGQLLHQNEFVHILLPEPKKLDLTPLPLNLTILYQDKDLAVLDKPAGLSVHPSKTEKNPTLVHGLLHQLKDLSQIGGTERPGIVHRLDKGTSGVLVISKTDKAHLCLSQQFKVHSIERKYFALVYGNLKGKGTIETFFGRHPVHRKKMTGKLKSGRKAITHWTVKKNFYNMTLLECQLETGRTHQIRVHLSELGYSIVGDPLYGEHSKKAQTLIKKYKALEPCLSLTHQLLHAYSLSFTHPSTEERLKFQSERPQDFENILSLAHMISEQ